MLASVKQNAPSNAQGTSHTLLTVGQATNVPKLGAQFTMQAKESVDLYEKLENL